MLEIHRKYKPTRNGLWLPEYSLYDLYPPAIRMSQQQLLIMYGTPTMSVVQHKVTSTSNATTFNATLTNPTGAGNLIAIGVCASNARAISSATDGTTSFTFATGSDGTRNNADDVSFAYLLSSNSGKTSFSVTLTGAATGNIDAWVWEVNRTSGSWAFDIAGHVSTTAAIANVVLGPTLNMTGSIGFAAAIESDPGSCTSNPKAGNAWTAGGDISSNSNGGCSIITSSAGNQTAQWSSSSATGIYGSSGAAFK